MKWIKRFLEWISERPLVVNGLQGFLMALFIICFNYLICVDYESDIVGEYMIATNTLISLNFIVFYIFLRDFKQGFLLSIFICSVIGAIQSSLLHYFNSIGSMEFLNIMVVWLSITVLFVFCVYRHYKNNRTIVIDIETCGMYNHCLGENGFHCDSNDSSNWKTVTITSSDDVELNVVKK